MLFVGKKKISDFFSFVRREKAPQENPRKKKGGGRRRKKKNQELFAFSSC